MKIKSHTSPTKKLNYIEILYQNSGYCYENIFNKNPLKIILDYFVETSCSFFVVGEDTIRVYSLSKSTCVWREKDHIISSIPGDSF